MKHCNHGRTRPGEFAIVAGIAPNVQPSKPHLLCKECGAIKSHGSDKWSLPIENGETYSEDFALLIHALDAQPSDLTPIHFAWIDADYGRRMIYRRLTDADLERQRNQSEAQNAAEWFLAYQGLSLGA